MADEVGESLKLNIKITSTGEEKLKLIAESVATLEKSLGSVTTQFKSFGTAVSSIDTSGLNNAKKAMNVLSKATDEAAKAANSVKDPMKAAGDAANDVANNTKKAGNAAKKAGTDGEKSANKLGKSFDKLLMGIGRVAFYRAIRTLLKGITDGFKTGIQNLARYSSEANASMSKLATASLYIKNSVGAAAMPIVEQMLPALLKLANYAVKALNAINQLMSALQGKSTYTRAKEYAVDYAATLDKSTSNASKSVQKLKRDLMGFDELNVLSAPDTGASAGGGGEDYSQMFEEAEISKEFEKAAKIVEKLKDNLDIVLGIVGAIGMGVASWRLAQFLGSLDESLSKVDLLKKSLSFAAGVTLTVIGITLLIKGIKSIVLEGINAENFAQMLGGALAVTGGGALIGLTFGNALLGAGIAAIVGGAAMIGAGIYSAVEEGLNLKNGALITLGTTFVGAGIGALFGPVGAGIGALIGLATGLIVDFVIWLSKNWDSVKQTLSDLWDWIKEHIITPIANSAQPIIDVITNIWGHIKEIAEGIIAAFTAVWQKISEIVDTIVQILKAVFGWIGGKIKDGVIWIIEKITPIVKFIKEKIIDPIWNVISNLNDKVGKLFSTIATKISDGMSKMIKGALNAVFWVVERPINSFIDALNFVVGVVNKIPGVNINRVEKISIPRFANGGMPEDGLFMANHNELVGQFSNGRTAVANNAQIQAGIEEAAYRGFMRAMSQSGGMGGQGGTYKFVAQLNGKTLFEEVVNQNNSTVKSTGNTPLLV